MKCYFTSRQANNEIINSNIIPRLNYLIMLESDYNSSSLTVDVSMIIQVQQSASYFTYKSLTKYKIHKYLSIYVLALI